MDIKTRQLTNEKLRSVKGEHKDMPRVLSGQRLAMSHNIGMQDTLWKVENCSSYRPCNKSVGCPHCCLGVPFRNYSEKPELPADQKTTEHLRGKSRNFRASAGRGVQSVFDDFDVSEVHAVTLGIYFGTKQMDCMAMNRSFRRRLAKFLKKKLPDAVVYLVADIAAERTSSFGLNWPSSARDAALDNPIIKAGLYMHAHGFIAVKNISRDQLRKILKEFLIGDRRVTLTDPQTEFVDSNGRLRGGYEGFVEYAAMEKIDLDMSNDDPEYDNVAMFEAIFHAREKWGRNARKIRINHRPPSIKIVTSSTVPTSILADLPLSLYEKFPCKWSVNETMPKSLCFMDAERLLGVNFCGKPVIDELPSLKENTPLVMTRTSVSGPSPPCI